MQFFRKFQCAISVWLSAVMLSAFTLKSFHHLEGHAPLHCHHSDVAQVIAAEKDFHCSVCDFFFSAFEQVACLVEGNTFSFGNIYSILVGIFAPARIALTGCGMRAPPVVA